MSIRKDIAKLTQLSPANDVQAIFMPVDGLGRAQQDLEMNNQPVRLRNGHIRSFYEEADPHYEDIEYKESYLDEIRSSVRNINGGELSNDNLEMHMRERQKEAAKRLKIIPSSKSSDSVSNVSSTPSTANSSVAYNTLENGAVEKVKLIPNDLQTHKYNKNGVIRGLLKNNFITLEDLKISPNNNAEEKASGEEAAFSEDYRPSVNLVPHPNDPDLLMHPYEAFGKLEYTQNFVLDRIGTKTTMDKRKYLMKLSDDDDAFNFYKKSK